MIEAVLLTGGRSSRMGRDKATLEIDGEEQAARIVRLLAGAGISTTVLGRSPVEGAAFFPDDDMVLGPLDALRRYTPRSPFVFVLSCDLPRFDPRLVEVLAERLGGAEVAAPYVDGFRQPMVALYRSSAFAKIPESGCPMGWLKELSVELLSEEDLFAAGVHPDATRGANTPEELAALVGETA